MGTNRINTLTNIQKEILIKTLIDSMTELHNHTEQYINIVMELDLLENEEFKKWKLDMITLLNSI